MWELSGNENLQDRETVLGFNLTSTKATSRSGQTISATDVQNGWESGLSTLEDFQQQDVLIRLSDNFWDNLITVRDSVDNTKPQIKIDPDFNNKVVDIDSLSGANYKEIIDQLDH